VKNELLLELRKTLSKRRIRQQIDDLWGNERNMKLETGNWKPELETGNWKVENSAASLQFLISDFDFRISSFCFGVSRVCRPGAPHGAGVI
jgi:hypothetical protein